MGRVCFPLKLFEIEEKEEDESLLFTCNYDDFERAIAMVSGHSTNQHRIIFVGLTEKQIRTTEKCPSVISNYILEGLRQSLSPHSHSKSIIQADKLSNLSPSDRKFSAIWLWGPPIQVSTGKDMVHACILYQVSQNTGKSLNLSEFGAHCLLVAICSGLADVSMVDGQTSLASCLKYLSSSVFYKHHKNILLKSLLHVLPSFTPKCQNILNSSITLQEISLMDQMGNQYNVPEVVTKLSDVTQFKPVEISLAKEEVKTLSSTNVVNMFRSCVKSANQFLQPDELPDTLRKSWDENEGDHDNDTIQACKDTSEPMEVDEEVDEMGATSTATYEIHSPLQRSTLSEHEVKHEYNKHWSRPKQESSSNAPDSTNSKTETEQQLLQKLLPTWLKLLAELPTLTELEFKNVSKQIYQYIPDEMEPKTKNDLRNTLNKIVSSTNTYLKSMIKVFQDNGYLLANEVDTYHQSALLTILDQNLDSSEVTKSFFRNSCLELHKKIKHHNTKIRSYQFKHVQSTKPKVINKYTKELTKFCKMKGPFPPKHFQKLTMELFTECMVAFQKATELKTQSLKNDLKLKSELDDLADILKREAKKITENNKQEYEQKQANKKSKPETASKPQKTLPENEHKRFIPEEKRKCSIPEEKQKRNSRPDARQESTAREKITRQQSEETDEDAVYKREEAIIQGCIDTYQKTYRESFKEYLKSPNFQLEKIRQGHSDIIRKTKKLFEIDMRSKLETPANKINNIWKYQVHQELEKVYKMYKDELMTQKSKAKEEEKETEAETYQTSSKTDKTSTSKENQLVFHVSRSQIAMASLLNDKPHILSNKWNKHVTKNLVAQTHSGKLIYGEDVDKEKVREKWSIGELIEKGSVDLFDVYAGNKMVPVRVEFFLGFLLKMLKLEAEKMFFQQKVSSCVICIPYSYTSMQRQMVKDAARIADFVNNVQLVNDMSAAAYEYAVHTRKSPPKGLFLIVTETSQNIMDAGFYKCDRIILKKNKAKAAYQVRMMAHAGTYHEESSSFIEKAKSAIKMIASLLKDSLQDDADKQELKTAYSLIRSVAINYHENICPDGCKTPCVCVDKILKDLKTAVVIFSPQRSNIFKAVIKEMCGRSPEIVLEGTMLRGASRLTQVTEKVGYQVVDLLSSSLWLSGGGNREFLRKGVELRTSATKFKLRSISSTSQVYQKLPNHDSFPISTIVTKMELNHAFLTIPRHQLQFSYGVKSEGIFYLTKVELFDADKKRVIKTLQEGNEYEVQYCLLTKSKIKDFKKLITIFCKDA